MLIKRGTCILNIYWHSMIDIYVYEPVTMLCVRGHTKNSSWLHHNMCLNVGKIASLHIKTNKNKIFIPQHKLVKDNYNQ